MGSKLDEKFDYGRGNSVRVPYKVAKKHFGPREPDPWIDPNLKEILGLVFVAILFALGAGLMFGG